VQEIGEVLAGVPGGRQCPQGQAAEIELLAVPQAEVRELTSPGCAGDHLRAVVDGQLDRAGEEVRVQVGVRSDRDPEPAGSRRPAEPAQVPAGVHGQGTPVAEVHQVRGVAEPLVSHRRHVLSVHYCPRWIFK
jgi:hypothetical protein